MQVFFNWQRYLKQKTRYCRVFCFIGMKNYEFWMALFTSSEPFFTLALPSLNLL